MTKRVFIIHGWDGSPENCWFPWLKNELEKKDFVVQVPLMPHPENPTIEDWVAHLSSIVGRPDENAFFVGHSIGCQTILRYIEKLSRPVGGVVCVAGFFRLLHLTTDEEKKSQNLGLKHRWTITKLNDGQEKLLLSFRITTRMLI